MKALVIALFLGVLTCVPCHGGDEGKAAPELQAKLMNGEKFSLAADFGQVVLVHFWASWCDVCKVEMPLFDTYYKQHHGDGLKIIAISMDSAKDEPKAREVMSHYSFPWAVAKEAQFKGYGRLWRLPLTFIIDRKGILRKDGWVLHHPMTAEDLETTVTPLLGAK